METYLDQGEDEFLRLVDTLPPTLLSQAPATLAELQSDPTTGLPLDLPGQNTVSIFASRLAFLSEFRDYLLFSSQGVRNRAAMRLVNLLTSGIAPVGFWAVLLAKRVFGTARSVSQKAGRDYHRCECRDDSGQGEDGGGAVGAGAKSGPSLGRRV